MVRYQGQIKVGRQGINIGNEDNTSDDSLARKQEIFRKYNEGVEKKKGEMEARKQEKEDKKRERERRRNNEKDNNKLIVNLNNKINEFNIIVSNNKKNRRPWFYGLEEKWDPWWHGMTEDQVRDRLVQEDNIYNINTGSIVGNSTDNIVVGNSTDNIVVGNSTGNIVVANNIEKVDKGEMIRRDIVDRGEMIRRDIIDRGEMIRRDIVDRIINEQILNCHAELASIGSIDLPVDNKRRLMYIYPKGKKLSFNIVAKYQVNFFEKKYLEDKEMTFDKYVEIIELDWSDIGNVYGDWNWKEKRNVLIQPFLYLFKSKESFLDNSRNFARLLVIKNKIGGFDVADSDRVSGIAVELINKIDLIIVPSTFSRDAYVRSGIRPEIVQVLPHGLNDRFLSNLSSDNLDVKEHDLSDDENIDKDENIDRAENKDDIEKSFSKLRKLKEDGKILILYFVLHSGYRKGADLVERVMKRLGKKDQFRDKVCLVVRSKSMKYFNTLCVNKNDKNDYDCRGNNNIVLIDNWLHSKDLVKLYDLCDILICPSRGGGFELNALEAASRGLVTLAPGTGCFLDIKDYLMLVDIDEEISKTVKPLPDSVIHVGNGYEVDMNDFERKLSDAIERLDYWKDIFRKRSGDVRERYSWKNIVVKLDEILNMYGFY